MKACDATPAAGEFGPAARPGMRLFDASSLHVSIAGPARWQALVDGSPAMAAQRRLLQRLVGEGARPPTSTRAGPEPAGARPSPPVQRQLDWSVEKLAGKSGGPVDDAGYAAVVRMLEDYLRLQARSGDGPHLATSLERLCFAAQRYVGRETPSEPPQLAALDLYRDAALERDRMAGIRNVAHQSPAFRAFDASGDPTIKIPAGQVVARLVGKKIGESKVLPAPRWVRITAEHGGFRQFRMDDEDYVVPVNGLTIAGHRDVEGELFPVDPQPDHVRQGGIGDCFLLAPAASIAAMNPAFIRAMMREDASGKVIVRLFQVAGVQGNKTFTPRYIAVDRSIATLGNGGGALASGALWVQMLEKAYAMSGLGSRDGRSNTGNSYENLSGGRSEEALEILLGREIGVHKLDGDQSDPMNPRSEMRHYNNPRMPWSSAEREAIDQAVAGKAPWQDSTAYRLFGQDAQLAIRWREFIGRDGIIDRFLDNPVLLRDRSQRSYEEAVTLEDIAETMEKRGLPDGIMGPINAFLKDEQLLPGRRGTGRYSREHLALYETLELACRDGKAITADTPSVVSIDQTNSGQSAREPKGGGLVGTHSYSVLAVKREGEVRYVQVRNPWGRYGRTYAAGASGELAPQVVDQGDGRSWIELVDFQRRFKQVNL